MNALQWVNLEARSKKCWICLQPMIGIVRGAYRYHSECYFKLQSRKEERAQKV